MEWRGCDILIRKMLKKKREREKIGVGVKELQKIKKIVKSK